MEEKDGGSNPSLPINEEYFMKISDLILKLEKARNLHGDLEVYHYDDWSEFSVEEVNFVEDEQSIPNKYILLGQAIHGFGTRLETDYEYVAPQHKPSSKDLVLREDWSKVKI